MANPIQIAKKIREYQKLQTQLKKTQAAGICKDQTVAVLIDGTMELVEVEVDEKIKELPAAQIGKNFMEAYKAARGELQKQMQSQAADLQDMLGIAA